VTPINRNPSRRDLVVFGIGLPILFGLLGWHRWSVGSTTAAQVLWGVGGVLSLAFAAVPPLRRTLYVGWMLAVWPIGFVVSHVILAVIFFGVFAPVGVLLRLFGRDPMTRAFDKSSTTYWIPREGPREAESYFRQS
jgi:hypothetical protein